MGRKRSRMEETATTWVVSLLAVVVLVSGVGCSPQQKMKEWRRDFQKEMKRQAAEPKTPEERCQRKNGVLYKDECYTPSAAALDERSCRLRGGLYVDSRCLFLPQENSVLPSASSASQK
ncbi:MAG: hypothetical protein HYZ50_22245 [Deltaproteobacteria bacterium]|nr:hypothetical protein [Deltaproteobacteria bacterium]